MLERLARAGRGCEEIFSDCPYRSRSSNALLLGRQRTASSKAAANRTSDNAKADKTPGSTANGSGASVNGIGNSNDVDVDVKGAHHPYEVPEITATPISHGTRDYLSWISEEASGVAETERPGGW